MKTKDKMEDQLMPSRIGQSNDSSRKFRIENINPNKYTDQICHNTPSNSTSGKYKIKIPIFDPGTPGEFIIFVNVIQKALV